MNFGVFYDGYHKSVKLQRRVINKKNFTYRHILSVLNKYFKEKNILDIGSGVGTIDFYLASRGKYIVGIELSKKAYGTAQQSAKKLGLESQVKFIHGDIFRYKTGVKHKQIICSEVIEHLENDEEAIKIIYKLLKKDGIALITTPSKNAPLLKLGLIEGFDKWSGHLRRYTMKQLKSLMVNDNLNIIFSKKTEGILRNSLFVFKIGHPIIRAANRFSIISDIITFLDNLTLKLFGESQLIVVVKK